MSQIESPPATTKPSGTRMPHVVGVAAGIAILAGVVLLWTGQPAEQASSGQTALGSTLRLRTQAIPGSATNESVPHADVQPVNLPTSEIPSEETTDSLPVTGHAKAILGTWKQYSYGQRLLNVKPDGTATIDVKLDGLSAIAFGEKLRIDITWEIQDQTLVFKTTGGTPEASLNAVKSIYGDNRIYQILEINEKQMLLREGEEDKTPWDRVEEE